MRLRDLSFFVDQVGDAARVFVRGGVGGAVCEADRAVGVAEEWEREVVFLGEAFVRFLRVEADAEDAGVFLLVLAVEVPEPGTFSRSAGCVGFWIEPEHDFLSAQFVQADVIAVVIEYVEVRGLLAGLEHLSLPAENRFDDAFDGHAGIVGTP
jgi:hypothetical protein